MLRDNLFKFSQIESRSNYLFSKQIKSFNLFPLSNTEVSSAYTMLNNKFDILQYVV